MREFPGEDSDVYERLVWLMAYNGLNPSSWAEKAELGRYTLAKTLDKRQEPKTSTLTALASAVDADAGWLLTGAGAPYRETHLRPISRTKGRR